LFAMDIRNPITIVLLIASISVTFYFLHRFSKFGFWVNLVLMLLIMYLLSNSMDPINCLLFFGCPLLLINTVLYVFFQKEINLPDAGLKYEVDFKLKNGNFKIQNIRRGASIIGAAGSGK